MMLGLRHGNGGMSSPNPGQFGVSPPGAKALHEPCAFQKCQPSPMLPVVETGRKAPVRAVFHS